MGWAKYDEDIRLVYEERNGMCLTHIYGIGSYNNRDKKNSRAEKSGVFKPETKIVKRPC